MRIWQAVGFTVGFITAELLSFQHRVWVLLGTVTIAAIVNLILEFTTQSKEELLPCVYRGRSRKSCDKDSESSSAMTEEKKEGEGSSSMCTSSPNLDTNHKDPAMDHCELAHQDLNSTTNGCVGQNPMFIMYGGRRPSTMSMWSADSLDGTLPSNSTDSATTAGAILATTNGGGSKLLLQQNGQNPLFVMYNGRRPSTDSVNSYKLLGERESRCGGGSRRPSAVSIISADSLDGTRPLISSSDSDPPYAYPPLIITTVPCMGSDVHVPPPPIRVLSPIHEHEDDNEEEDLAIITNDSSTSSTGIHRSNSYMAALDSEVSMEYSRC